jgi:hypothetical protein
MVEVQTWTPLENNTMWQHFCPPPIVCFHMYNMVQNILSFKQVYDYFENVISMAPFEDLKPLDFFPKHSLWRIKFSNNIF